MDNNRPRKKAKLSVENDETPKLLSSLMRSVSPPLSRKSIQQTPQLRLPVKNDDHELAVGQAVTQDVQAPKNPSVPQIVPSPFQLTHIKGLSELSNRNAVKIGDILGDPLVSECWQFNYIHDIDWLMAQFDSDVVNLIQVHIVHGFWKDEDSVYLKEEARKRPNIKLHCPHMPEMFGTHHTKMMVLFRHDDFAQIIIHTANMIEKDWTNMTQALWQSPLLPLSNSATPSISNPSFGSGSKFKVDFMAYLEAYNTPNRNSPNQKPRPVTKALIERIEKYDFSEIRGTLIGSVPGRHVSANGKTSWGCRALTNILENISCKNEPGAEIVAQVSSIATLGVTDVWLKGVLFDALRTTSTSQNRQQLGMSAFKIIFPTANEVRRSLDGYASGGSIHTKTTKPAQKKQVTYLKPFLCHWMVEDDAYPSGTRVREAGRKLAAPHIKTYLRYSNKDKTEIDWALLTSANISKQAWGEEVKTSNTGEFKICSFELGVLVWPALFGENTTMVPTFGTDIPRKSIKEGADSEKRLVGLRMPYDLPVQSYKDEDEPWCVGERYEEKDRWGNSWPPR